MDGGTREIERYDVLIIGAGLTGLHQLYSLLQSGLSVRVFDAGAGVGGTWYWNRYPGARFDSESYSYSYGFSEELLKEWEWSEHFAGQPEIERYLNHVADKFNLRPHIQLNARVSKAVFDADRNLWRVETEDGRVAEARFVVAAVGYMSAHYLPDIPGIDSFEGTTFHTARWPHEPVAVEGKRVGIIGTGPTGVQIITEISKTAGHLTVFQRTPVYALPLRNGPIAAEMQIDLKRDSAALMEKLRKTYSGFIHEFDTRPFLDLSEEERRAHFEAIWAERGFAKWFGNFQDVFTNRDANEIYAEFIREKIRERVHDPVTAEKLSPRGYAFGSKRVPLESGYYEAYNRDNVRLVSVRETPIERITPKGVKTSDTEHELDILIFATGFDAITGELTRIDFIGEGGRSLKQEWAKGVHSYLGLQAAGFPNLFLATAAIVGNVPRCSEIVVDWVTGCIRHMNEQGLNRVSATPEAEAMWQEKCAAAIEGSFLVSDASAWFMGTNIPGKKPEFLLYGAGVAVYRQECAEIAAKGYEGFVFS